MTSASEAFADGLRAYDEYQQAKRWRDDLADFLGPAFEQFMNASAYGEG